MRECVWERMSVWVSWWVSVSMCVREDECVCVCVCERERMSVWESVCVSWWVSVWVDECVCVREWVGEWVCEHVCVRGWVWEWVGECVCMCVRERVTRTSKKSFVELYISLATVNKKKIGIFKEESSYGHHHPSSLVQKKKESSRKSLLTATTTHRCSLVHILNIWTWPPLLLYLLCCVHWWLHIKRKIKTAQIKNNSIHLWKSF